MKKDQKRIVAQKKLSALLLVRGKSGGKLLIADGYHRLCAVYAFDENASVPCKLVKEIPNRDVVKHDGSF